jgi:hypothetical protein
MIKMAGAVTALAFVAACASTQKYEAIVATWIGRPVDELVLKWGPPASLHFSRMGTG